MIEVSSTRMVTDHHKWSFDTIYSDALDKAGELVKWEEYRKILYLTKDKIEKDRHDFVTVFTPYSGICHAL